MFSFCLNEVLIVGEIHRRGDINLILSFSPLFFYLVWLVVVFLVVGEITQERRSMFNSRSPLSEPGQLGDYTGEFNSCRGDTQGVKNCNSRSPPMNRNCVF